MKKSLHLEGLRGIAAFIVFMAHFKPTFCIDINNRFLEYFNITGVKEHAIFENIIRFFYEGELPVFIFWFMSAYVISIKLFDPVRNANNDYLVASSTKRYFRLAIPVFFSSLLSFILMKTHCMFNHELADYSGSGYKNGWLDQWYNFSPGVIHFLKTTIIEVFMPGNDNYNIALWTMNPELMGSFMCFGLFAVIGRNKMRFIIYLAVITFLIIGGFRDNVYFFYLTFAAGLLWSDVINSFDNDIYLKEKIKKLYNSKLIAIILLISGFAVPIYADIYKHVPASLYYFFCYPVKAIGITLMINNTPILRRLFSTKPFTFMGKISFSFYLIHIPVMFSAGIYLYMYAGIVSPYKTLIVFCALSVITILLAWLFMKFIDKKSIKLSDHVGKYFTSLK